MIFNDCKLQKFHRENLPDREAGRELKKKKERNWLMALQLGSGSVGSRAPSLITAPPLQKKTIAQIIIILEIVALVKTLTVCQALF